MPDSEAWAGEPPDPGQELSAAKASSSLASYREQQRRADLTIRVAWLRATGWDMFNVDLSGQTTAALWDFADLLEALEDEGRWAA